MKPSTVDTWIWSLLYGGLLVLSLSVFVARRDTGGLVALVLQLAGGLATAAAIVLFVYRSRMKDSEKQ